MSDVLYFDCNSGASGDMILAALLDLGLPEDDLRADLKKLDLDGYHIEVRKAVKSGITGTDLDVVVEGQENRHDHDHHEHHHEHHDHHDHPHHPHRGFTEIRQIITSSTLPEEVKELSLKIFLKVAEAEARIHGTTIEEVHFHEVGAVDSMVDIIGAAIGIHRLKPDLIVSSPIPLGTGFVRCAHGRIPVPAPATIEILRGVPVFGTGIRSELTTPTGAAILGTICSQFGPMPEMTVESIGYGLGKKDLPVANLLRVFRGKKKNLFR